MNKHKLNWKQVEKILRQSEEKYRRLCDFNQRILDNAPLSIIVINSEGTIISANSYFLNFSGSNGAIGRSIYDIDFFKREKLARAYQSIFKTGKAFSRYDCQTVNGKGETKFINIFAVPLRDLEGKVEGVISMAIDNTEVHFSQDKLTELKLKLENEIKERRKAKNNLKKLSNELESEVQSRVKELNRLNRKILTSRKK